ncbi:hypothetical protein NDU88_000777 [Pleurodeles waltl]|uniref:Uncharacterized protein n=1 Tax=Pleurodeles waltl TaxID=8319 RepID=A0AAV7R553_PLEWA|nr:hypothetical protein NDU88_000777 [Pleurodeles waltl]
MATARAHAPWYPGSVAVAQDGILLREALTASSTEAHRVCGTPPCTDTALATETRPPARPHLPEQQHLYSNRSAVSHREALPPPDPRDLKYSVKGTRSTKFTGKFVLVYLRMAFENTIPVYKLVKPSLDLKCV